VCCSGTGWLVLPALKGDTLEPSGSGMGRLSVYLSLARAVLTKMLSVKHPRHANSCFLHNTRDSLNHQICFRASVRRWEMPLVPTHNFIGHNIRRGHANPWSTIGCDPRRKDR
jgi:hypothetical protein